MVQKPLPQQPQAEQPVQAAAKAAEQETSTPVAKAAIKNKGAAAVMRLRMIAAVLLEKSGLAEAGAWVSKEMRRATEDLQVKASRAVGFILPSAVIGAAQVRQSSTELLYVNYVTGLNVLFWYSCYI